MGKIDRALYAGKIDSARILLIEFSRKFPISNDKKNGAIIYSFKSDIERASGNFNLALKYMLKSLSYKNFLGESSWYLYHKIANIYFEKKDYEMAKIYADSSMNYGKNPVFLDSKKNMNYKIVAYYYLDKKDYSTAEKYYHEILNINQEFDCDRALTFMDLFTIYKEKRVLTLAKNCVDSAIRIAKDSRCNAYLYLVMAYNKKIELARTNRDYKTAYETLELKTYLQDSVSLNERIRKNKEIEEKYESKLVKSRNKNLRIKNQEIEKRSSMYLLFLIVSSLLLLVIITVLIILRKRNKEIKINKEKLERLNELHQKIFNVISHDFNGSFMSLQILLDEIQLANTFAKELSDKVEEVQKYLNQSNYVLQNLTNWAKIELNMNHFTVQEYPVKELIDQVIFQLSFQLKSKNIVVKNNVSPSLTFNLPKDYLTIIFRNILNNSIKFSHKNGVIEISSLDNKIEITDFGIGIEPSKKNQLFKQKVESGLGTDNETGFGIGLKIVSEIIAKFDGQINVHSEINKGTTISLNLPPCL